MAYLLLPKLFLKLLNPVFSVGNCHGSLGKANHLLNIQIRGFFVGHAAKLSKQFFCYRGTSKGCGGCITPVLNRQGSSKFPNTNKVPQVWRDGQAELQGIAASLEIHKCLFRPESTCSTPL